MKSCKKCGQDNLDDAKFCSNCGEKFSNNTEIGNQKDLTDSKIERTNLPDDISGSDVQKKLAMMKKKNLKLLHLNLQKYHPLKKIMKLNLNLRSLILKTRKIETL